MNYFVNRRGCDYKILGFTKSNPMPMFNKRYLDDVEYCLLFRDKEAKFSGEDTYNNSFKFFNYHVNQSDKKDFLHPTIKPFECVKNHLEKAVKKGSLVLDPFIGSGTTAVACKSLGIDFIGFEIDDKYYKIACNRLNNITEKEVEQKQMSLFE